MDGLYFNLVNYSLFADFTYHSRIGIREEEKCAVIYQRTAQVEFRSIKWRRNRLVNLCFVLLCICCFEIEDFHDFTRNFVINSSHCNNREAIVFATFLPHIKDCFSKCEMVFRNWKSVNFFERWLITMEYEVDEVNNTGLSEFWLLLPVPLPATYDIKNIICERMNAWYPFNSRNFFIQLFRPLLPEF